MKNKFLILIALIIIVFLCGCNKQEQPKIITKEEAINILEKIDYKDLDLSMRVDQYEVRVTNEIIIDTTKCYLLETYVNGRYSIGKFAVSKDGKKVYKNSSGKFIIVK